MTSLLPPLFAGKRILVTDIANDPSRAASGLADFDERLERAAAALITGSTIFVDGGHHIVD
jgi:hypothetical protein